jgi:hypothetical protein
VPQTLGARRADPGVPIRFGDDILLALGLNVGEFKFFSQELCELFQVDIYLKEMVPRHVASLTTSGFRLAGTNRRPNTTLALTDAACVLQSKLEAWKLDVGHRNADQIFAPPSNHLGVGDVFAEVFPDIFTDDLPETAPISFNSTDHVVSPFSF